MLDVSFSAAFLAGLLSFVSPCVLPIVPPYLCYLAGISFEELSGEKPAPGTARRIVWAAVFFVTGFATVFVALGATASVIGQTVARYFDTMAIVAGIIIAVMGLHFLGVFRIGLLYREARVNVAKKPAGLVGAYVMGARVRLRLDAVRRPGSGGDPVHRGLHGDGGQGGGVARGSMPPASGCRSFWRRRLPAGSWALRQGCAGTWPRLKKRWAVCWF